MSDTRLRELERRWRETGAVEDEASFLVERVRSGEVTRERIELSAYCGYEAALRIVPEARHFAPSATFFLPMHLFNQLRQDVACRCAIAVGRVLAPLADRIRATTRANHCEPQLLADVVVALEDWALSQKEEDLGRVRELESRAWPLVKTDTFAFLARDAAATADHPANIQPLFIRSVELITAALGGGAFALLRDGLAREVGPWLLGTSDPLRSRSRGGPSGGAADTSAA